MFTGLIERIGKIVRVQAMGQGKKFLIDPGEDFEAGARRLGCAGRHLLHGG